MLTSDDCQSCGACCGLAGIVAVRPEDGVPETLTNPLPGRWLGPEGEERDDLRCMKHPDGGPCIAFKGQMGRDCSCSIYENRPLTCRAFAPGSVACLRARAALASLLQETHHANAD